MKDEGPEAGHTFRITHTSRGSYMVEGEKEHHDEPEYLGPTHVFEVRAWSLRAALLKAADMPFEELMGQQVEGT